MSVKEKIKVLLLCDKGYWLSKMSRVRFHAMNAIVRQEGIEAVKDGPNFDGWVDCPTSVEKHKPDVVFWYKPLVMEGYEKVNVPKVISYNEMWWNEWTTEEITKSGSDIVICHHENDMVNYDHLKDKHVFVNISHCAEQTVFRDYGNEKVYDVLFIGVVSDQYYPLRTKLFNVASRIPKAKVLSHPGYKIEDVEAQVVRYAEEINKAKIVLTCSSKYKYALAKYSEVPMCNSLLMADIPGEREKFFRKFVVELRPEFSEEKITRTIKYWLARDELRNSKTELGRKLTLESYTQEHYAKRFKKAVVDFLNRR